MRVARFERAGELAFPTVPDPSPGPDEVVVEVAACGVCGTDIHLFHGEFDPVYPLIPGHEFAGTVVAVGREVRDVQVGERVAVDPNLDCGECYFCRSNLGNHCERHAALGVTRAGGFAPYVAVPRRNLYPIGDLSFTEAAMVEPLACVVYGVRRLQLEFGADVLLVGAGPIGLLMLQCLRHGGASRVTVLDLQPRRLELAKQLGADLVVQAGPEQDRVLREIAPRGFAAVVDVTGVPAAVQAAIRHVRNAGSLLVFGVCPEDATIAISPYEVFRRDLRIIGSFALYHTFYPALALLTSGAVKARPLVSHTLPLEALADALVPGRIADAVKVQIAPGG